MFSTGLSEVLVESLTNVANALPELLPQIQEQLLDLISLTLARQPFKVATPWNHHSNARTYTHTYTRARVHPHICLISIEYLCYCSLIVYGVNMTWN
jgi:hypothetical protein